MKIDDKLAKIGFEKISEDARRVHYNRYESKHDYYHSVVIERRQVWNEFRLQSYDDELLDRKGVGNTNVALSTYEVRLFLEKMQQKEIEYARNRT